MLIKLALLNELAVWTKVALLNDLALSAVHYSASRRRSRVSQASWLAMLLVSSYLSVFNHSQQID